MAEIADTLMELLGNGLSQAVAAEATGCTEGYVSQLMAIPEFRNNVLAKRAAAVQQYKKMDDKMDTLEDAVLDRLQRTIQHCFKPVELSRIFRDINGAKRRSIQSTAGQNTGRQIVQIIMPAVMRDRYQVTVDVNNRVVQIGTDTMVPASATTVHRMAEERRSTNDDPAISSKESTRLRIPGPLTVEDF